MQPALLVNRCVILLVGRQVGERTRHILLHLVVPYQTQPNERAHTAFFDNGYLVLHVLGQIGKHTGTLTLQVFTMFDGGTMQDGCKRTLFHNSALKQVIDSSAYDTSPYNYGI